MRNTSLCKAREGRKKNTFLHGSLEVENVKLRANTFSQLQIHNHSFCTPVGSLLRLIAGLVLTDVIF